MAGLVRHLRGCARRYALLLASCQLAVLSSSTLVVAVAQPSGALTVSAPEECTCEHTTGVMCPMHRRSTTRPIPAGAPRWCHGVDGSAFAVLPALGTLALPERSAELAVPHLDAIDSAFLAEAPRRLARPPDSPPPRA